MPQLNHPVDLAVYYFPNYHLDKRNEAQHGKGWTEWELVKRAEPRFPGHIQPKLPLWGYEDESDPANMAKKIDAAADHGIDAFIFDWYWYNDGSYLKRGLEDGFLGAPNCERLKFALMWANHDWVDIHPIKRSHKPFQNADVLYPGAVSAQAFYEMADYCIENYFVLQNYWKIDGCPYFSFYELSKLMEGFGSLEESRAILDAFREKARRAGFPDLHLNAVVWNTPILPGETTPQQPQEIINALGFDSVTSYVWIHHYTTEQFPEVPYSTLRDAYMRYYDNAVERFDKPCYPNVTMGWDSSPRTVQSDVFDDLGYPFMYTVSDNTPKQFEEALLMAMDAVQRKGLPNPFITINAWNEWTEGSYLEPDTRHGMNYLKAIKAAKMSTLLAHDQVL